MKVHVKKRLNFENAGILRENLISLVRSVYKIVALKLRFIILHCKKNRFVFCYDGGLILKTECLSFPPNRFF